MRLLFVGLLVGLTITVAPAGAADRDFKITNNFKSILAVDVKRVRERGNLDSFNIALRNRHKAKTIGKIDARVAILRCPKTGDIKDKCAPAEVAETSWLKRIQPGKATRETVRSPKAERSANFKHIYVLMVTGVFFEK